MPLWVSSQLSGHDNGVKFDDNPLPINIKNCLAVGLFIQITLVVRMYNLTAPTTHYRPSDSVNSILIDYLIFQGPETILFVHR